MRRQVAFRLGLLELVGIDQRAVDQQVGIAADRRGEVRVAAEREAEVARVLGPVIGLRLAAQHRFHDLRLLGLVGDVLEHAVEQAGRDHLAEREAVAEGRHVFLERDQLLAARRLVDAVDHRRGLGLQCLGRGDVGGDHEVLDHAVRVEPLAHADLGDLALVVEPHLAFGQLELERVAGRARGASSFHASHRFCEVCAAARPHRPAACASS